MKICVDTEALDQKCAELRSASAELEDYMNQIESVVLSIGNEWQGDAERAYTARLLYIRQEFRGITGFLEGYAELLETISAKYEAYDKELSSKIYLA